ncbi:MAG TPA: hypothetical protein VGV89_07430 [Thermoplasmata archaeon]|nr:hypothetical protein [Thermoplasmata archaeon]
MVRSRWAVLGLIGTAALVLLGLGTALAGLPSHSGELRAAPVGPAAAPHALVSHASPATVRGAAPLPVPWINVTITNTLPASAAPPITLNFTINVTGVPISPKNESATILITAGPSATLIGSHGVAITAGQANYSVVMDYLYIGGESPMPTSTYVFNVSVSAWNNLIAPGNPGAPGGTAIKNYTTQSMATMLVDNPGISITSTIAVYDTLPIQVNFLTSFDPANSGIVANAMNMTIVFTFAYTVTGAELINLTLPFNASGGYAVTINASNLAILNYNNGVYASGVGSDSYAITASITAQNSSDPSFPTRTVEAQDVVLFTTNTPTVSILSPTNKTTGLYVGNNVTITTGYQGDFVTGANVTVTPAGGGQAVYTQGIFTPGPGGHASAVLWVPGLAGKYTITAQILTPYGSFSSTNTNVTILAASANSGSGISYVNSTTWHNASLLGGLSPGVASALLLVVGLVIGMIVALALGRMMWASGKPAGAQPWSASKGGAGGANECSVCHQTFGTPEELKDHQKQAHGMG